MLIKRSPKLVYKSGYKYQIQQPYIIQTPLRPEAFISNGWVSLDADGIMMFAPGYTWDGPSGAPDWPCTMAGSLMHDGGYQLIREGLLPKTCKDALDQFMAEVMRRDHMWPTISELFYWAVHQFGKRFIAKPTKTISIETR